MICPVCGDRGIVRLRYRDASPDEFGVCLCAVGQALRHDREATGKRQVAPLWQAWAAREHVDTARVAMLEELVEANVLTRIPQPGARPPANAIADVMRTKRARL